MPELPTGTITFLFTDIESSTALWEGQPDTMREVLLRHDRILHESIASHGGVVFSTGGDGFAAAFQAASSAVSAALDAQRHLSDENWPGETPIRVRMAVHTGEAHERDGNYFGPALNRTARLMGIGHGGQLLCSGATAALLASEVIVRNLGEHRLRDLDRPVRVFQLGAEDFPPLRSVDAFPGNLPLQVSSFVGREREIARVSGALREGRIITLTGVGGVGKTRLALQVAAEALPHFREGAWLAELATVRDPEGVVPAVAAIFGVIPRSQMTLEESLIDFLRTKQLLLILDNCEHVLDAVADFVMELERSCANVVVLATSREGLAVDGERLLPVPSLPSPIGRADPDEIARSESGRLFMERARSADPEFALTTENASAVAQVCRRLDGIPLAIELAAARIVAMNPAELAQGLDHRFETLAGGRRRAVQRHQTLRAAIDWSFDLLTEPERQVLVRLAVFAGGATRQAAETLCIGPEVESRQVFVLLTSLVAKSLVVAERGGADTRYRLLETIREYGEEHLAETGVTESLRTAHSSFYAAFLESSSLQLEGPHQIEAAKRIAAEAENIIAAVNHAVDTLDVDVTLRLVRHSPIPALQVGYSVWLPIDDALDLPGASAHRLYPYALVYAGQRLATSGDLDLAEERLDRAMTEIVGSDTQNVNLVEAKVEATRTIIALGRDQHDVAARHCERAAAAFFAADELAMAAYYHGASAMEWALAGDLARAAQLATDGLQRARMAGMPSSIVFNLCALAFGLSDDDPQRARALLREGIELRASLGYENSIEIAQAILVAARLEDWPLTLELASVAIPQLHWMDNRPQLAGIFNVVARSLASTAPEGAAMLQGAIRGLVRPRGGDVSAPALATMSSRSETRNERRPSDGGFVTELRRRTTELLTAVLGEQRLQGLRRDGEAMHEDDAVAYALQLIATARADRKGTGQPGKMT